MSGSSLDATSFIGDNDCFMSLPPNFCFAWNQRVAGSAHPGTGKRLADSLAGVRELGVASVLTLTEEPLDDAVIREFQMDYCHLPIEDFAAPTRQQVLDGVRFLDEQVAQGHGALVHCRAGLGRTGTLLACFLVARGMHPDAAIEEVRRLRPGSLETYAQEFCVYRFARERQDSEPSGEA
jgi:atypical dual specificity phosphatase